MDFEAIQTREKLIGRTFWPIFRMNHKQHVREAGAEVSAVCVVMTRGLRVVDVHAFGAVQLNHGLARQVGQTDWQHRLVLAVDPWTVTEVAVLVLIDHLSDAAIGQNEARVDQTVEHLCSLLDQVRLRGGTGGSDKGRALISHAFSRHSEVIQCQCSTATSDSLLRPISHY